MQGRILLLNCIFKLENVENQKCFIDSTTEIKSIDSIIEQTIYKFNIDVYQFEILEYCLDCDLSFQLKKWSRKLKSYSPYGYNENSITQIISKKIDRTEIAKKILETKRINGTLFPSPQARINMQIANKKIMQNPEVREKLSRIQKEKSSAIKLFIIKNQITNEILKFVGKKNLIDYINNLNDHLEHARKYSIIKLLYSDTKQTNELLFISSERINIK